MELPPRVEVGYDDSVLNLWHARARQHTSDSYAGVPLSKFPEDLRVYEHLLWDMRPDAVIEIGVQYGGSALWFRDRLATLERYGAVERPIVVAIDIETAAARERLDRATPGWEQQILLIEADVTDPALPDYLADLLPADCRCMVVEDSAHVYDTTRAALDGFARFVPVGGYFVVEDGCVDIEELRIDQGWPRGVLPAIQDWLASPAGSGFVTRPDLELYGLSCHPRGFLARTI